MRKSAAAQLLSDRIGNTFDAIVTGRFGEGNLGSAVEAARGGKAGQGRQGVKVGDELNVQLAGVNVERGFIDFTRPGK